MLIVSACGIWIGFTGVSVIIVGISGDVDYILLFGPLDSLFQEVILCILPMLNFGKSR